MDRQIAFVLKLVFFFNKSSWQYHHCLSLDSVVVAFFVCLRSNYMLRSATSRGKNLIFLFQVKLFSILIRQVFLFFFGT
ncbi:hypothetical protein EDC96DRAFT_518028, partial [Choanephora cucurbitarum]